VSFATPDFRHSLIMFVCALSVIFGATAASSTDNNKRLYVSNIVLNEEVEVTRGINVNSVSFPLETVCTKVRRRLWLEGEGWVVRRVGQCRQSHGNAPHG
jgi:hypothetical protein